MAGIQGQNQLLDFLRALRRRRWQIAVPTVLVSTVGVCFAVIVPKKYHLSTRIEVNASMRAEPDARLKNPQEMAVWREAPSATEHVVHYERVKEVIERNLAQWPEYVAARTDLDRQLFIKNVLKNLFASPTPTSKDNKGGTIFVDISYSDERPERAAKLLEDLSYSWLESVFEQDKTMLIQERAKLQDMVDADAKDLRDKEDRLYKLNQLLGQDPTVLSGSSTNQREDRGDWTFKMLDKKNSDLNEVKVQLDSARTELRQASERYDAEPDTLESTVAVAAPDPNVEIEKRKALLAALQEQISNKRPGHSEYKKIKDKIDAVQQELDELASADPPPSEKRVEAPNPRKDEYLVARRKLEDSVHLLESRRDGLTAEIKDLEDQTRSRTSLYQQRDDLLNDVSEARKAFNATTSDYNERDKSVQMLEGSPRPWRIAQPPVPSSASVVPNPYLIAAFAVFAGLAMGVGLAVLSEYARSSYRTVGDLAAVMSVPVLGAIETIVTRRERRRLQLSRAVAGLSTALIVGTLGWVTWLWSTQPERLPVEVQDAIEHVRSALK